MEIRPSARIGAFACLGVALAMGLLALREEPAPSPMPAAVTVAVSADPLKAALRRCQLAGEAAGSDPTCLATWAENRRRFLGSPPRLVQRAATLSIKSTEPAAGNAATDNQEQ